MIELSEPKGAAPMSVTDSTKQWDDANKSALHFMIGAQRMMLEEMAFAGYATLDRVRTETHLFGEFASKLGAAHRFRIGRRWAANVVSISSNSSGAKAIGCSGMGGD